MRGLLIISLLVLSISTKLFAVEAPYAAESKAQTELEALLSRLIPPEQFLVQVTADVTMRSERKLVEGEFYVNPPSEMPEDPVRPMPGFEPNMEARPNPKSQQQSRQVYRSVETPVLSALRVTISLDQSLPPATVTNAKRLVHGYISNNFPRVGYVSYNTLPMLKPPKKETPVETPAPKPPEKEEEPEESPPWVNYMRWGIMAFVVICFILLLRQLLQPARASSGQAQQSGSPMLPYNSYPGLSPQQGWPNENYALPPYAQGQTGGRYSSAAHALNPALQPSPYAHDIQRKRVLEKFLSHTEAFRQYYERISPDARGELHAALGGPALDQLLESLGLQRPVEAPPHIPDMDERTSWHEKQFDEFVLAAEWQDRQFFGFLHHVNNEQLVTLMANEPAESICLVLRFLKPAQCAVILDSFPQDRRQQIIAQVGQVQRTPLNEILAVENRLRGQVARFPTNLLHASSSEDMKFWGEVFSESQQPDTMFEELEKTNPEIYPHLRKYKFSLEDSAALPDALLARAFAETDNQELGLALSTCSPEVAETIMESLPERRRHLIEAHMPAYRAGGRDLAKVARANLTRKIREMMEG